MPLSQQHKCEAGYLLAARRVRDKEWVEDEANHTSLDQAQLFLWRRSGAVLTDIRTLNEGIRGGEQKLAYIKNHCVPLRRLVHLPLRTPGRYRKAAVI